MIKGDNFPLRLVNKFSVRRLCSNYVLFIPVFTTLSADLKGSGYDAARVEYVNWLIFYLCGFHTACSVLVACDISSELVSQLVFGFYRTVGRGSRRNHVCSGLIGC